MPGPKSTPVARTKEGRPVSGKTALRHANLKSGENLPRRNALVLNEDGTGQVRNESE